MEQVFEPLRSVISTQESLLFSDAKKQRITLPGNGSFDGLRSHFHERISAVLVRTVDFFQQQEALMSAQNSVLEQLVRQPLIFEISGEVNAKIEGVLKPENLSAETLVHDDDLQLMIWATLAMQFEEFRRNLVRKVEEKIDELNTRIQTNETSIRETKRQLESLRGLFDIPSRRQYHSLQERMWHDTTTLQNARSARSRKTALLQQLRSFDLLAKNDGMTASGFETYVRSFADFLHSRQIDDIPVIDLEKTLKAFTNCPAVFEVCHTAARKTESTGRLRGEHSWKTIGAITVAAALAAAAGIYRVHSRLPHTLASYQSENKDEMIAQYAALIEAQLSSRVIDVHVGLSSNKAGEQLVATRAMPHEGLLAIPFLEGVSVSLKDGQGVSILGEFHRSDNDLQWHFHDPQLFRGRRHTFADFLAIEVHFRFPPELQYLEGKINFRHHNAITMIIDDEVRNLIDWP